MVDYEEIRKVYGGDDEPPRFIIHRRNLILAVCVRSDLNPRIHATPAEIWLEEAQYLQEWSEILAWDTGALRLFTSPGPGTGFRDRGMYHVIGSTDDSVDLAQRMSCPGVCRLSRIVFLSGPHLE